MTTDEVPMPEPDVYRYEHWIDGPRVEWSLSRLDHSFTSPCVEGYVQGSPHFSLAKLRAYADARCAKLQEECDGKQKQIHRRANAMNAVYAELQRAAPWSESNDMDWADEMICGIGLLAQERDALAEKVKALEGDASVERAAIAISNVMRPHPDPVAYWEWLHEDERKKCRKYARAAIDAARPKSGELTQAMGMSGNGRTA